MVDQSTTQNTQAPRNWPDWVTGALNPEDLDRIERAVKRAERLTSGEIVPVIVRSSSTVGHVPVICFLAVLLFWNWADLPALLDVSFSLSRILGHALGVATSLVCAHMMGRWGWFQRRLTSRDDLESQVNQRAEVEFFELGMHRTRGGTGVLIFLSMMERKVVVLADQSISCKLPSDTWSGVVDLLVNALRKGELAEGFERAIGCCGELLSPHFPRAEDDTDELKNHLIIK